MGSAHISPDVAQSARLDGVGDGGTAAATEPAIEADGGDIFHDVCVVRKKCINSVKTGLDEKMYFI